jgi:hypothetical protein
VGPGAQNSATQTSPPISWTLIPKSPRWEGVWLNVCCGMLGGARPACPRTVPVSPLPHFVALESEVPKMEGVWLNLR